MSCHAGPDIVENGLVFCYDMNNTQKSWRGKPTTNLASGNFFYGNGNFTVNNDVIDIMPDGSSGIARELNAQIVVDPNRTVSIGSYNLTAGSTYTLSFYAKNINCTGFSGNLYSPTLGRVIGGITYPSIDTKNWTRVITTFTVPNEGPNPVTLSPQVFRDGGVGLFRLCWLMLEEGTIASSYTSSVRSNTQAIIDLTNKSIITASGLTYNSDGSFDFNYANSSTIQIPLSTAFNKLEGTINVWIYPTRYNGANGIFSNRPDTNYNEGNWLWIGPYSGTFYFRLGDGSSCCSNDLSIANYQSYVPLNSWTNLCCTWKSANTSAIYINGQLNTSRSISTIPNTNPHSIGAFGVGHAHADGYFHGKMPIGQIYNRQLSPSEVSQNFNATRKRYGI